MDLDVLTAALDHLGGSDPITFADTESIEVLHRELARLEALVTQATAAFDSLGNWVPDGALNATAWLTARCRIPRGQARRQVRRGRELRHLPACGRAWSSGEITGSHVDTVAGLRNEATDQALARDEQMLVDQAASLRFDRFVRAANYWKHLADPDGADRGDEQRRGRRDVYLVNSFDGMWLGAMTLDPVSGSIVSGELERLEQELFDVDWGEARASLRRDPQVTELARTAPQRRADALVEMATRSRSPRNVDRRSAPLFTVLVGWETLYGRICQLEDGTALAPGSLLPWLDRADLERAVFAPGRRVEISPRRRLFTGATRRAIEVRDRECTHPMCAVPAASCQIDHIQPWALGGPTTQENGRVLCQPHNRARNQRPPPAAA